MRGPVVRHSNLAPTAAIQRVAAPFPRREEKFLSTKAFFPHCAMTRSTVRALITLPKFVFPGVRVPRRGRQIGSIGDTNRQVLPYSTQSRCYPGCLQTVTQLQSQSRSKRPRPTSRTNPCQHAYRPCLALRSPQPPCMKGAFVVLASSVSCF
jgi:hypothetical protein